MLFLKKEKKKESQLYSKWVEITNDEGNPSQETYNKTINTEQYSRDFTQYVS